MGIDRSILVVALPDCSQSVDIVAHRIRSAWPGPADVNIRSVSVDELHAVNTDDCHGVVVAAATKHDRPLYGVLAGLEDSAVPTMVLFDKAPTNGPGHHVGAAALPLAADDGVIGAVLCGLALRQPTVDRVRRELGVALQCQGGIEGELSRMHEEMQLAAMVQREFLPRELPSVLGVNFGVLWRPANYVSGDIYDVVRLDEDHVGMFLADAVGHGVPAALMTMIIARSLMLKEIDGTSYRVLPPSEVLARLNEGMIRRQGRTTRFATAIYAVINCRSRRMKIAGAGHPPPIIMRHGAEPIEIETDGGLLGVFENEVFEEVDVELAIDDRLLVYSDGFEQAFPDGDSDAYGRRLPTRRYRDEFDRLAACADPTAIINELASRLDQQMGSLHQIDDLTMVAMHAGSLTPDLSAASDESTASR